MPYIATFFHRARQWIRATSHTRKDGHLARMAWMHELVGIKVWTQAKLRVLCMEMTELKFHALYSNLFP